MIAGKVIECGLEEGIVVLPIHDSFSVQKKCES